MIRRRVSGESTTDARGVLTDQRRPAAYGMGRVLLIENDPIEAETLQCALRARYLDSVWTRRGAEGLAAARDEPFSLALVDHELPDMAGGDVIRMLRHTDERMCVFLLAGLGMAPMEPDIVSAATGVLRKPLNASAVIALLSASPGLTLAGMNARRPMGEPWAMDGYLMPSVTVHAHAPGSIAERWASLVLRTLDAKDDPKTVDIWAKAVGVSRSVLSECCRLIHVATHDARDFARVMRAICRCGDHWQPEAVLNLADSRTLKKLLAGAGLEQRASRTPTMPEFLDRQRWIPAGNPGLTALRTLLFGARRPLEADVP